MEESGVVVREAVMGAGGTRGFAELDRLLQGHICSGHQFPLTGLSPHEAHYVFGEAMAWFRVARARAWRPAATP
jgi:hypothetical protein